MNQWVGSGRLSTGQSAVSYDVEVLVFATANSDSNGVVIDVAGTQTLCSAAAGRNVYTVPAAPGAVSVAVKRSGATVASLSSPITIRSEAWQQNMEQFVIGSNRPIEQFDPTQTNTGSSPVYPVV